jgi:acetoin:2,6-dichlorophenolindophenol oxidoreductase subunit beta
MQKILYREAICQALDEEMARDKNVFVMGEDVGVIGGNFKCTAGLRDKYGDLRCKDTPIAEQGFIGMCVGAAITGLRPVPELMFGDFMLVCMDQIANQMAKITYMSGGKVHVPMTIRMPIGGGRSSAAQHSQTPIAMVANMPGMKVVMPSNGYEAKGLLKSAIRDNNPVIFMEHKMMYTTECEIPEEEYLIPIGKANVLREGTDITVVAISIMVGFALKAAEELVKDGINVEVIDLRSIVPWDKETVINSVKKTGKLLIIDEGHESFGISGEICLTVMQETFYDMDVPVMRMGTKDVPLPFSPALEFPIIPDKKKIIAKIREMV